MSGERGPNKSAAEQVKDLVEEVCHDLFYTLAKAAVKQALAELKKELREKTFRTLMNKLGSLSEQKLDSLVNDSIQEISRAELEQGNPRELIERQLKKSLKKRLRKLSGRPVLKAVLITAAALVVLGGGYILWYTADFPDEEETFTENGADNGTIEPPPDGNGDEPFIDTVPPEVIVRLEPDPPGPEDRIVFIAEAEDREGLERIELVVDGVVVAASGTSPCTFTGGPYEPGSTVRYSANAWDTSGNRASTGTFFLEIPAGTQLPDLVVIETMHEWEMGPQIAFSYIYYTVQNRSNTPAGASVTVLWYGNNQTALSEVGPLEPGQTFGGRFPPLEIQPEAFKVEICADARQSVPELDEGNNCVVYEVLPPLR